jgi:hypothetical protein
MDVVSIFNLAGLLNNNIFPFPLTPSKGIGNVFSALHPYNFSVCIVAESNVPPMYWF